MIFFLSDGHIIYGVSVDDRFPECAGKTLEKMKSSLDSSLAYVGWEAPPGAYDLKGFSEHLKHCDGIASKRG